MKAIIIEDEMIIAKQLSGMIKKLAPDVDILAILPSLKTARKWFAQNADPDLMFMDIQLSDGVSFEIFDQFDISCPVIFTSAYDEYAIKAFKKNGVDYLLKPIIPGELSDAISKCRKQLNGNSVKQANENIQRLLQNLNYQNASLKEVFIVHQRNQLIPVYVKDIACFLHNPLNYIINFKAERFLMNSNTLDEIENQLSSIDFYRANRQHIINIRSIESVKMLGDGRLLVKLIEPLKEEIEVSKKKAADFRKWLDR